MDSVYVFLRKYLDYTQQEVVSKYNNMPALAYPPLSEQFLRRLEQGTVSENDHMGLTEFWRRHCFGMLVDNEVLYNYREALLNMAAGLNCPILPIDTNPLSIEVCYESWFIVERYALRKHSGTVSGDNAKKLITAVTQRYDKPNTVYAFCRLLKLHPFVVQRWVKQSGVDGTTGAIMPVGVRTALEQAGWTII